MTGSSVSRSPLVISHDVFACLLISRRLREKCIHEIRRRIGSTGEQKDSSDAETREARASEQHDSADDGRERGIECTHETRSTRRQQRRASQSACVCLCVCVRATVAVSANAGDCRCISIGIRLRGTSERVSEGEERASLPPNPPPHQRQRKTRAAAAATATAAETHDYYSRHRQRDDARTKEARIAMQPASTAKGDRMEERKHERSREGGR